MSTQCLGCREAADRSLTACFEAQEGVYTKERLPATPTLDKTTPPLLFPRFNSPLPAPVRLAHTGLHFGARVDIFPRVRQKISARRDKNQRSFM